jgi:hypothetical protein
MDEHGDITGKNGGETRLSHQKLRFHHQQLGKKVDETNKQTVSTCDLRYLSWFITRTVWVSPLSAVRSLKYIKNTPVPGIRYPQYGIPIHE